MSLANEVVLSSVMSLGVVLLVAINQFRTLRRDRGGDEDGPHRVPPPVDRPTPDGARVLPACLVPNPAWRAPGRVRERV